MKMLVNDLQGVGALKELLLEHVSRKGQRSEAMNTSASFLVWVVMMQRVIIDIVYEGRLIAKLQKTRLTYCIRLYFKGCLPIASDLAIKNKVAMDH